MFTVDLLKGRGIPEKSGPVGITVAVMTFAVPVVLAIILFGAYLSNAVSISVKRKALAQYQKQIDNLSAVLQEGKNFEKQKKLMKDVLAEIAKSIDRHMQWSEILVDVVRKMPDSMVLTKLEVKQDTVKKRVAKKGEPDTKVTVTVPIRTLQISVGGRQGRNYDGAVRDFSRRLRESEILGPKLENIRVSKDSPDTRGGVDLITYQIDCIFKPSL